MIGVVVAAHGSLASALLHTAKSAIAEAQDVVAIGIELEDDAQSFERRLREATAALLEETDGVLVLTDMFGGSPSNIGMTLHKEGRVEILTGVNLPMLVKVLQSRLLGLPLGTVAEHGRVSAQRSIAIASEVLGLGAKAAGVGQDSKTTGVAKPAKPAKASPKKASPERQRSSKSHSPSQILRHAAPDAFGHPHST